MAQIALELLVPLVGCFAELSIEERNRVHRGIAREFASGIRGPRIADDTSAMRAFRTAAACRSASVGRRQRRGQNSRGRKLTIVSIMSSGAGSVGVSARPALPTTMSTSGNRQRIMSRAFRSSADWVDDIRGTVIGMSITIPSSSGVMNSRPSGVTQCPAGEPGET